MLEYDDLERRWKALRARGWTVREVACVGAPRTLLCAERTQTQAPIITLSAGVHGDEPAGPAALLQLAESDAFDGPFAVRCWPCTNPSGFRAGTRVSADGIDINRSFGRGGTTPEARAIVTSNRDRRYHLALDLHEDDDCQGFYCYAYGAAQIARRALHAVQQLGMPLDPEAMIEPDPQVEAKHIGGLSYALSLVRRAASRVITFEAPSSAPFQTRVAALDAAVRAAVLALDDEIHPVDRA